MDVKECSFAGALHLKNGRWKLEEEEGHQIEGSCDSGGTQGYWRPSKAGFLFSFQLFNFAVMFLLIFLDRVRCFRNFSSCFVIEGS